MRPPLALRSARAAAAILTLAVFLVDAFTRLDIAIAVLYVVVVLLVSTTGSQRATLWSGVACALLTLAGFLLSRHLHPGPGPSARCAISLMAIATTTLLVLRNLAASAALQRAQADLAHATRITTLGELATSIAHEVTQPIAAIATCGGSALRWLDRPVPDLPEARRAVAQMVRDAERAGEIVHRIRMMARRQAPAVDLVDLNRLVHESLAVVRRELQEHRVATELVLGQPAPHIAGDRIQLQQVLLNLLLNAVQAMAASDTRRLRIATAPAERRRVSLMVEDTGPGFRPEDTDKLFTAFYTTRPEGLGMGLSICRSIVEAHGGTIHAGAAPGGGARLTLTFPLPEDTPS